jgi:hypothetical protein
MVVNLNMFEEFIKVAEQSFPVAVAAYLLFRIEGQLQALTSEIRGIRSDMSSAVEVARIERGVIKAINPAQEAKH